MAYAFLPHYLEIIASLEERLVSQQHRHRWMLFSGLPILHCSPVDPSLRFPKISLETLTGIIITYHRQQTEFSPSNYSCHSHRHFSPPFHFPYINTTQLDKRKHFPLCIISQTCQMSESLHSQHAGKLPRAEGHLSPKPTAS